MLGMIKKWFKKKEVVEYKMPSRERSLDPMKCFHLMRTAIGFLYREKYRVETDICYNSESVNECTHVTVNFFPILPMTSYDIPWKIFSLPPTEALKEIKEILGIKDEVNEPTK